jgi:signal transduction histidine kinase
MSSAAVHPSLEELRGIDLFDELDDEQLARWAAVAEIVEYRAGEVIYEAPNPNRKFLMLLDGVIQVLAIDADRLQPVSTQSAPTWLGAIPVLTETPMAGRLQAESDVRVAAVEPEDFIELALSQRSVHRRVMRQVRPMANRFASMEQNRERLASLGTMAAGLAHELNNPAAAARRASSDLADALEVLASTIGVFVESGIERSQAQELVELQREALAAAEDRPAMSGLDAADAEEDLAAAMEDLGVSEPWRLAEPLAAAGLDPAWLQRVAEHAGPATAAAIAWIAASLTARSLASELAESTDRMGKLVKAIKSYAFMDRGALVEADIHEGLETTLVVLGYKLKHTAIEVERDYDKTLPRLTVHGGELNQVWTNLLDNAIGALGDSGTIKLTTRRDGVCVRVDIADDGPGIKPEDIDRIFDPFFTTKDVGQGTGLGLDTARRIVEARHHGTLGVESEPGNTVFHVWLPLDGEA